MTVKMVLRVGLSHDRQGSASAMCAGQSTHRVKDLLPDMHGVKKCCVVLRVATHLQ
jgi:hypothetical protein